MVRLARYGKILKALSHPSRTTKGGKTLLFEQYYMTLSHEHYLLALFCLLSLRPQHKGLSRQLWLYIKEAENAGLHVKPYIYNYAEVIYFDLLYSATFEERSKAISIATRREKNPAYRGKILAINIETKEEIFIVGVEEIKALGFCPNTVYNCLNDKPSSFTHKGHIFVRLRDSNEKTSSETKS